ncbi:hypothetical protein H4R20_000830 [Coemansia guatemalensis]|uniref:Major facilitator superfamily (MFS) profile domain-containing protein n=1 Tax=Coemansia guatemalensis TaxID=2761395 RepID=A0A9W8I4H8_9FUNG|nr:hypothetical protein H4R20_000830 [Coemansia guatemalensis]
MYMVCAAETMFSQIVGQLKKEFETSVFAQWIEGAFLLTCVMVQPVWVKLAEKFGRPWPLFVSIVIFMAFSIMVGAAKDMGVMVVGRALQGVGGAGMMPLALVVLTDILTPSERPVYMGLLGAVVVLGKWTGPLVGAALLEHSSWRWAGYLNLPAGAGAVAILAVVLYDMPTPPGSAAHKLREFDYLGTLFWLGGSMMILLGLSFGGSEHPWRSVTIICLFVFGFIAILVFAGIEAKLAKWPIIPLRVLSRPRTLLALVSSLFIGVSMYGTIMFTPVYYMFVLSEGPLASAKHIMWVVLGGCLGSVVAGLLVNVRGRVFYREWAVLGTAMMTVGYGLLYLWPADPQATGKHAGYQVLVGLGLGFCMQQVLLAAQAGLPVDEISTVTTLVDYARTLGGMVGLVIGQVILKEKMFETVRNSFGLLAPSQLEGQDVVDLEGMAPMLGILPQSMAQPVYDGIVRALNLVFVADVPFAALACIMCLFLANIPLHVILPARRSEEIPESLRKLHRNANPT